MSAEHILVIEDNHDLRVLYREHLEQSGHSVITLTNGLDALNLLKSGFRPQLIFLDINLPLMNGFEFLKEIETVNSFFEIPVVLVTGQMATQEIKNAHTVLEKPVDWQRIDSIMKEYC